MFCLQALADPYFKGLAKVEREPSCKPFSKLEFEFERRRLTKDDVRELIYREILEYHPQLLKDYMSGTEGANFLYPRLQYTSVDYFYPLFLLMLLLMHLNVICNAYYLRLYAPCSAVDQLRKQFTHLEENDGKSGPVLPLERKHVSLPR